MEELRFDRAEDGRLILVHPEQGEFALEVTEALRAALREMPRPEVPEVPLVIPEVLRPKDIQALVRGGADPQDLAASAGLPLEQIMRYAAPVFDERAYIATQGAELPISHDDGAATLRATVEAKLLSHGVEPETLVWDAIREHDTWVVRVDYVADDGPGRARWAVNLATRHIEPLGKQAAWLLERDLPDSPIPPVRHLTAVSDEPEPYDEEPPEPEDHDGLEPPLSLLDSLMESRGLREPAEYEGLSTDQADVLELHPAPAPQAPSYAAYTLEETYQEVTVEPPLTVPTPLLGTEAPLERVSIKERSLDHISQIQISDDTTVEPGPEAALAAPEEEEPPPPPPTPPSRSRAKRSSVPSWDEIVFGAPRES
ncbi:MAG: DUF3071 domain-containing protein [Bifidobacteriaceae bacterium]|jgi:hypothetical protein|nr:DUF3071 domain-containing protein [Bifidobacteriaceae bacterium]